MGLDHLFGETLSVKLAHGVIMGKTHTNADPNLDPRPNPSKLSDLGQRLNRRCNLSNFQFPFWTKKVLTGLGCGLRERLWTCHPKTVLWTLATSGACLSASLFAFNWAFLAPCLVSYFPNNRNIELKNIFF